MLLNNSEWHVNWPIKKRLPGRERDINRRTSLKGNAFLDLTLKKKTKNDIKKEEKRGQE